MAENCQTLEVCGCGTNPRSNGIDPRYKTILWIVIAMNVAMFVIEMTAGHLAESQALLADALDFLGDTLTYGLSLAVIEASLKTRASAAMLKGVSLMLMGLWVFGSTVYQVLILGVPQAQIMAGTGFFGTGGEPNECSASSSLQGWRFKCSLGMAVLTK